MIDPPPAGPGPRAPEQSERPTVSRPAGFLIAGLTAALVFGSGSFLWPVRPWPPALPVVALAPPPHASFPLVASEETHGDSGTTLNAASNDGPETTPIRAPDSAVADSPAAPSVNPFGPDSSAADQVAVATENVPLLPSDGIAPSADGAPGKSASDDCALPEKDMAREAWRRNWPAVCPLPSSGKAFILIPTKGPISGETHALHRRPTREARITLTAGGESLLTMKQYKVRRLGFKELRVIPSEEGGTRLRIKLQPGAGDPVFDVKDGYVKVTVAVP